MPLVPVLVSRQALVRATFCGALTLGCLISLAAVAPAVRAQNIVMPQAMDGLTIQASASADVTKDVLMVTFTATREGPDAQTVQSGVKQALDAALGEAKKVSKPGQIDVQTGQFSLYPRHSNKGVIAGWVGTAELIVQGKDIAGIGQLTGRIQTMSIARVQQDLSREARQKVDADVMAQAIANFRAKAALVAKQFGYSNYQIRDVHVSTNEPMGHGPNVMVARARMSAAPDETLPVEAGKGQVTATVQGSVTMLK